MNISHDLIGCPDDADLAELLEHHPQDAEALFAGVLGSDEAVTATNALKARIALVETAGLFHLPEIDPALPEIVLLHGITDCHLANVAGRKNRIWLDYLELIKGSYSGHLTLQEDGVSDQPKVSIQPDGPVSKKYDRALRNWRQSGFRSHVYCYDWRKTVLLAADRLRDFLQGLEAVRAGRKVLLVCHSMGGLVAASYATRHADWEAVVEHCVFVGSPLGGSYSVALAILGKSPSFQKMDRLSIFESLADLQRMAASFPGLVDMLPNPEVFPAAEDLYSVQGWPGGVHPRQQWLDHSREVKRVLWDSPIFAKSTHLVSQDYPTVAELPWNADRTDRNPELMSPEGDGAVLNRSSLAPGLKAFKIPGEHAMLLAEPQVIAAVESIAKQRAPELTAISAHDLSGATQRAAAMEQALAAPSGAEEQVTERFATALARRLASDGTVGAMLGQQGNAGSHGLDRQALRSESFSWQNALSLAIASELAYQMLPGALSEEARGRWGFAGCMAFDVKNTQGFVAWDEDVVLLSFRGTEKNFGDWLGNFNVAVKKTADYGPVHQGFYQGFQDAKGQIQQFLQAAEANRKKLWVTGHSLGGALAVIAGAELHRDYSIAGLYTYGQPKVGREPLARFYDTNFAGRYFRVVNNEDVVPKIPPGFQHFGELIWFDAQGNRVEQSGALAAPGEPIGPSELSEAEFQALQQQLRELSQPVAGGLVLPPSEDQIEAQALFGISVSDHSIREAYIPTIAKQF